ncbi:hypothetical protein LAM19_24645, partial [Mycobacterium tuberculosis]|nr:hypothetical protein [Mycobacterium tuberculosis]
PDDAGEPRPLTYRPVLEPADPRHVPGPRPLAPANNQGSLFAVAEEHGPGVTELIAELAAQTSACTTARNPQRLERLLSLE